MLFFAFLSSHATSIRNNRFRRDVRAPDEDEEIWFSQEDENEENESGPQVSELLKSKLDSDLDHIHKLWESKKGNFFIFDIHIKFYIMYSLFFS